MKFDPIKKKVYSDNGVFMKQLNCPYKMNWDNLVAVNEKFRKCTLCDHLIIDTAHTTDDDLLISLKENPKTCLKIDLNQHNIIII